MSDGGSRLLTVIGTRGSGVNGTARYFPNMEYAYNHFNDGSEGVALEDVEFFDTWHYQPERESFNLEGGLPQHARSLLDITGGRFNITSGRIQDASSGRFVARIATTLGAFLEVGSKGTILLSNIRPTSQLRDTMGTRAIPRLYVQGDLASLGETEAQPINRVITLAPRGELIYVNDRIPSGKSRYARLNAGVFGGGPIAEVNELGRLASSEELIRRGVAGWLARNAIGAVERLKLTGITLPDGTTTVSGSEIVKAIAANIAVTPIVTYVLSGSE
jgi:hypothetical protein